MIWFLVVGTIFLFVIIGIKKEVSKSLNNIFVLFMIIDLLYISYYLIKEVPKFINLFIKYLQNMTSSLDAVILVALITGFISLVNSFYSRYSESKNKRREYLSGKREEPYSEFINMVYKLTRRSKGEIEYTDEEVAKDIQSFNSKITLWGSPEVVKKWIKFRKKSIDGESEITPEQSLILVEDVMNEMRKDLGVKSVNKGNLLSIFINDFEEILKK